MRRRLALIGLVAFVFLDAGLVALALKHGGVSAQSPDVPITSAQAPSTTPRTTSTTPGASPADSSAPTTSNGQAGPDVTDTTSDTTSPTTVTGPTSTSTTTGTSTSTSTAAAPARRMLLDVSSDGSALRADVVRCGGGRSAKVEVSKDGGRTWTGVGGRVGQVLRISARSGGDLWFASTGVGCTPSRYASPDFSKPLPVSSGNWSLRPDGSRGTAAAPTSVSAPGEGSVETGCPVVGLAPVDETNAHAVCADGTIRRTRDGGATWQRTPQVTDVLSMSFSATDTGFALARRAECRAAVLGTTDGGVVWSTIACLEGDQPQAIAVAGNRVLAMVDGAMQISENAGLSWRRLG